MTLAQMKATPLTRNDKTARAAPVARRAVARTAPLLVWGGLEAAPQPVAFDPKKLVQFALGIWHASFDARHAVLRERWTASSGVTLPDSIDGDVLRFHTSLKYGDERAPGLIWLVRDIHTGEPCAVLRYFLDDGGNLISRKTLGRTYNSAIKLDADEDVSHGLIVASSIEDGLKALNGGLRPVWALIGASALADFPVIDGVECLTVTSSDDDAVGEVVQRWSNAGREVTVRPP